jgi:hypothetical protein
MNKKIIGIISDALAVAGAFLISLGAGMVYRPAGLIAAGVLTIAGAVILSIGGGDG